MKLWTAWQSCRAPTIMSGKEKTMRVPEVIHLKNYRDLVVRCLAEWEAYIRRANHNGIEVQRVFDEGNGQYMLLYVGWDGNRRVHKTILHVRLRDDKIWIEEDDTEEGIATALVRAGVPQQDVVLAFHAPKLRYLTDFASA
jgi:hypothetical protein